LDVRYVCGVRLLQVKNPWSHQRWKGPFSPEDSARWTPALKEALHYDVHRALQVDNGIFWIDWDSLCYWFDRVSINWDPRMFRYVSEIHAHWALPVGPKDDKYNLSENPQYSLRLKNNSGKTESVWVLLSKHYTDTRGSSAEMGSRDQDFLALHMSRCQKGGRVFFHGQTQEPEGVQGIYSNSPHHLLRFDVPVGDQSYTLVPSHKDKEAAMSYTIKAYCTLPFELQALRLKPTYRASQSGSWAPSTGPSRSSTSPVFKLSCGVTQQAVIRVLAPPNVSIAVEMVPSDGGERIHSGAYRQGQGVVETVLRAGEYTIAPTTYKQGDTANFMLQVDTNDAGVRLSAAAPAGALRI